MCGQVTEEDFGENQIRAVIWPVLFFKHLWTRDLQASSSSACDHINSDNLSAVRRLIQSSWSIGKFVNRTISHSRLTHCSLYPGPLCKAGQHPLPEGPVPHHLQDPGGDMEVLYLLEFRYDPEQVESPLHNVPICRIWHFIIGPAVIISREREPFRGWLTFEISQTDWC